MRSLRLDPSLDERDDDARDDFAVVEPKEARPSRALRAIAAFLLGLTLGVTGILIGQSAFERHMDLFGPTEAPPPLRR